ncbi:RNA polymerase sigma-70 factor [Balneolaceae bacterium YR4-1]|uniref:RNA polymerase sigma-70 factor n=1 Tax=Halalkalibaculum roseum TaxID=2709311 RepID=A0A6M1SXR1_9BACT|nr:RNA polymerase sigma-70 factor [Halalkalibaculum roseum]NGP76756.1 RNA polymerase sigma-70 factor [Halalkalibaculum roseum]
MDSISDQQFSLWAKRIRNSDEQAFKAMFDATFENFVRYAWKYTKTKDSAMDIVQESFIKLWNIRERLDPAQSLKTYFYRMVKHKSLNYLRDVKIHTEDVTEMEIADSNLSILKDDDSESSKLLEPLKRWIDELPDRQQEAFKLSRYEGLTHEEIAEVMEVSPRTVNNHIGAALNHLQERYKKYKDHN